MKKIFYLLFTTLLVISCDNNFEEINVSPNDSDVTDPNLLLTSAIIVTQNSLYNAQIGGDMGLCWAQHWSKVQYNDEEKYIPRRALMNSLWTNLYASSIAEASTAADLAEAEGNTNLQAAAIIMKANAFQILTDVYGPVPFTEAGVPGNTKPVHDSQEFVYDGILSLLDQADVLLANGSGEITASADLLYAGDVAKWRKFGASLKLKVLMRISKKRDVSTELTALVNSGLLMSSNSDSAELVYTASQPDANPLYETIVYSNRAEYKVSSVLIDKLNNLSDPRKAIFAQLNVGGQYVGNIPGEEHSGNYGGFSSPGTKYLDPTLPGVILSYSQVELYLAEAALEGYISGGITTAVAHYRNGITANMEWNGVSASAISTYLSQPTIDFSTLTIGRTKIGEQMWLTLYGQGIEAWTEWRRTGVPTLSPVVNAAISAIPKRFYFSTDTQNYNQENYQAAVSTLDQGDSMLSKVWWMN
ncbi:SusD/RagB family nutrient-binding outer membrane lipoprotein [Flavobacterium capsici]|uniref:SusD/RagB family nutrient-binding outer membrane lipoprotein n=1 Tax=Flavobacterium capsici TaxID=3075618 RepID=A0AA96J5B6_9FLAO|nr:MULTISPECIES: SusD/RagB family nutrient-binding outer membrane lipoprotein [unclassified Flavobacterium]WNM20133.1 SusD/RagB family nutrient-binding outer membrane lipoprotein [Flavobacterium sp. PMR2A8]WNM21523.1 SusD/RagB family nutrient-binding outer membrane lipoprotein [Flavobacterium sp. PMTSA4]